MTPLLILYDGACPFCSAYVSLLRLRASFALELLSARSEDARVSYYRSCGYRLDDGMLVVLNDAVYVGADAMHVLAMLSESGGWLNQFQRMVFARRWLSRLLYPWLRAGRRLALWLRRVPLIDAAKAGR
jgi:predicted DCC family thiol-disulfide oxidoreductase YuxK